MLAVYTHSVFSYIIFISQEMDVHDHLVLKAELSLNDTGQ